MNRACEIIQDTISQERIKMVTKEPKFEAESGSSGLAHQRKEEPTSLEVVFRGGCLRWDVEAVCKG